ncbi:MAG TPA: iron chelate uptake ABC transporter family permease subunit, partial [Planctomycetota bacterium]|nr:iron chelate uptake ABC transporter family permease subunit [Planctomycetota bacterium]
MKRIPSGPALLFLVAMALAAVGLSILAGPTRAGDLTRDIVLQYRLPRGILAFLVGASLGASGVCFQGLFRNPLADPFVVGVSSGAALGAVAAIVLGFQTLVFGLAPSTAAAFIGALGAAFLAYAIARVRGRVPITTLLLAGSAIGSFAGAMVSILILINSPRWSEVVTWLMGSMSHPDPWSRV